MVGVLFPLVSALFLLFVVLFVATPVVFLERDTRWKCVSTTARGCLDIPLSSYSPDPRRPHRHEEQDTMGRRRGERGAGWVSYFRVWVT